MKKEIEDLDLGRFSKKIDKSKLILNKDGSYNYKGDLDFSHMGLNCLSEIPIKLKEIYGYFACEGNNLISLQYSPEIIHVHTFWCRGNQLISLQYAPMKIGGELYCGNNPLLSLKHNSKVGNDIYHFDTSSLNTNNNFIKTIKRMTIEQRRNELKFFEKNDQEAYKTMLKILDDYDLPLEEFKMCHTVK